jgi:hypothetical protein
MINICSDTHGHFMAIKRQGILTYAFTMDVTTTKISNWFTAKWRTNFKSEILLKAGA